MEDGEAMNINEKMTAIANPIRSLAGSSDALGLDAMASHLNEATSEVVAQNNLIEQIKAALDGKVGGGGGDVELPELTNPATSDDIGLNKEAIDSAGKKIIGTFTLDNEISTQNDLINQLAEAVNDLPNADNNDENSTKETISVQIYNSSSYIFYITSSYELVHPDSWTTFDALHGMVFNTNISFPLTPDSGDYINRTTANNIQMLKFNSDGGTCYVPHSGGATN